MALRKMFKMVGERYPNPKLTAHKDWFRLHTWTDAKQAEFSRWLYRLIKKRHSYMTKKRIDIEVGMFVLNWGWRCDNG
jgi:hypothetical protein